jgi:hypothetical protein
MADSGALLGRRFRGREVSVDKRPGVPDAALSIALMYSRKTPSDQLRTAPAAVRLDHGWRRGRDLRLSGTGGDEHLAGTDEAVRALELPELRLDFPPRIGALVFG